MEYNIDPSWQPFFLLEQQKPYFQQLDQFIAKEYQSNEIFPAYDDLFTAFLLTPFHNVKVVVIGQDPYHDFNQAHGLAFSVKKDNPIPKSLQNIYKELKSDLGITPPHHGDLSHWAKQGVLLLNTILTVEAHKPLSHKNHGWETFTTHVIDALNKDDSPKVFVLWGNQAISKQILITNPCHQIFTSSHPSPLSARHSFFGSKVFSRINTFLKQKNSTEIDFKIPN